MQSWEPRKVVVCRAEPGSVFYRESSKMRVRREVAACPERQAQEREKYRPRQSHRFCT